MSDVQAKTYSGGQTLPALTDDYQAVQVGRNNDGELVPEQRAFVATVRNRSDGDMFVKEGNGDGIRIAPGESYVVMRTNGTSQIHLKGTNVGTDYEIRTVEAHNDFSLTDRVEGFVQSVSALLRSSRSQAVKVTDTSIDFGNYIETRSFSWPLPIEETLPNDETEWVLLAERSTAYGPNNEGVSERWETIQSRLETVEGGFDCENLDTDANFDVRVTMELYHSSGFPDYGTASTTQSGSNFTFDGTTAIEDIAARLSQDSDVVFYEKLEVSAIDGTLDSGGDTVRLDNDSGATHTVELEHDTVIQ